MLVAEPPPATLFFIHLELISVQSLCSWQNKFQFHTSEFASVTDKCSHTYPIREQIQPYIISFRSMKLNGAA